MQIGHLVVIFLFFAHTPQFGRHHTIKELLEMEEELHKITVPSIERDAKVNLLKYLQIFAVQLYEEEYDAFFHELNVDGGLEVLRNISRMRSKDTFLQPKVFVIPGCGGGSNHDIEEQARAYLSDAKRAKPFLDELINKVVNNVEGCEAKYAEVKTLGSTVRKAEKSYNGNVRRVADMARVAVVCETADLLEKVYTGIMGHLRVRNKLLVLHTYAWIGKVVVRKSYL